MAQLIGVVLAGGGGRRMGRPKGGLEYDGATLADRAARALWKHCASVLVSVREGAENPAPSFEAVTDEPPEGRGPLAGIQASFRATGQADLLVLACDYPKISEEILGSLADPIMADADLVMTVDAAGRDHPLVARWNRGAAPMVDAALAEKRYKVRAILPDVHVVRLGPETFPGRDLSRDLFNVNHPEDLLAL